MNNDLTEHTVLQLAIKERERYKKQFIKQFGLAASLNDVRNNCPDLLFLEDDEIEIMISEAVVEFVENMINDINEAFPLEYADVPDNSHFVEYADMLKMEGKRIFDRKERVILEIIGIKNGLVYFDDDTFIGEDYKHDQERYVTL